MPALESASDGGVTANTDEEPMPRTTQPETPAPSTALALPDDIRADLLRSQADQISTPQRLPTISIMNAGANLYEFSDTQDTQREFRGVILNSHPRNLLWDKRYGSEPERDAEGNEIQSMPACVSSDGKFGVPRPGFAHAALQGRIATGTERVACATCPYNQWESKGLLFPEDRGKKGKATTNQRVVYVMVLDEEGRFSRETPMELVLPPTSLVSYDEFLATLLNRSTPVQAVVTKFAQTRVEKNGFRWSVATFQAERALTEDEFNAVMAKRATFRNAITAPDSSASAPETVQATVVETGGGQDDDDLPF